MKRRRLAGAALLALLLAPGTLVRTQIPDKSTADLAISRIADLPETRSIGDFTREGVWQLTSSRIDFGGYSAMLLPGDATIRAFSDRGKMLTFAAPGQPQSREVAFAAVRDRGPLSQTVPDIEAATRDPDTGEYWLAFESTHSLIRYSADGESQAWRLPPSWQDWPANGGAEALERLPDGRFIVLPENSSTGLLYPADPTGEAEPLEFGFAIPGDYDPTDMAALPDGRVLVLLRQLEWAWPPFSAAIGIADPGALAAGGTLDIDLLIRLDTILPSENYEALAVDSVDTDGTVQLWLMSDDNLASFQRSLLARLSWRETDADDTHEKAREE